MSSRSSRARSATLREGGAKTPASKGKPMRYGRPRATSGCTNWSRMAFARASNSSSPLSQNQTPVAGHARPLVSGTGVLPEAGEEPLAARAGVGDPGAPPRVPCAGIELRAAGREFAGAGHVEQHHARLGVARR